MHFAASAYVGESMRDPRAYFRNNVGGTLALLDAMLEEDVRSIVFSSTCATYGIPEHVPITEDEKQRPVNPYGESKLFVERALMLVRPRPTGSAGRRCATSTPRARIPTGRSARSTTPRRT